MAYCWHKSVLMSNSRHYSLIENNILFRSFWMTEIRLLHNIAQEVGIGIRVEYGLIVNHKLFFIVTYRV
jgi:hypothetical protein